MDEANQISNQPVVKVFSTPWCGFCKMVKSYLDSKGVAYTEVDIEQEPDAGAWLVQTTNQAGVPVTFFDGKEFVIGYDRPQIDELLKKYKLA